MRTVRLMITIAAAALTVLAIAGCGGGDDGGDGGGDEAGAGEVIVDLEEVEGSGQTGTATLTPDGNKTRVLILIDGEGVSGNQPAHIHEGTCAQLNPEPAFGLLEVQNSFSETTVDAPLASLQGGKYAINLHMSPQNLEAYTSCGDIP